MERKLKYIINSDFDGKTVKEFLRYNQISTSMVTRLKKLDNGIMLNGERVFVTAKLSEGDILELLTESGEEHSEFIFPTEGKLDIIYEDEDFLAVNKPPYLPVHPSKGHPYDSLANIVVYYYKQKNENFTFRCVNRLDKDTSGVTLIAKNAYAHELMRRLNVENKTDKTYYAIVHGKPEKENGLIDLPIYRPEEATIKRIVDERGKQAKTLYETVKTNNKLSLIKIKLLTGRTHQIRVHFSHIGHPLAGDFLYGDENDGVIARQALHCGELSFIHPINEKQLILTAELPEDMKNIEI
ncbi:MAG: RluA family pseudouridine synthase [Ruminococcaceae bacterium]|nr:RluA family pseudouridine synthase [Oscillospiraceae bacterium]